MRVFTRTQLLQPFETGVFFEGTRVAVVLKGRGKHPF